MTQMSIKQVIHAYFAAIQDKNVDAWVDCFAVDGANHDPVESAPNVGHAALRQFFLNVIAAFAQVEIAAHEMLPQGDRVAVTWQAKGLGHQGREVHFAGIDVFEFNAEGKIRALWGFWDPATMFAELNA